MLSIILSKTISSRLAFNIALRYSLYVGIAVIIQHILLVILYQPGRDDYYALSGWLTAPILLVVYPLVLLLAHRHYRNQHPDNGKFGDILMISAWMIFLTYCIGFIIGWITFKQFIEETVVLNDGKTIMDLFNNFVQPHAPKFAPLEHLLFSPFTSIYYIIVTGDYFQIISLMLTSPVCYTLLVLHIENLYLIFSKYQVRAWFALVPVLNTWTLIQLTHKSLWWIVWLHIPFVRYFFLYAIHKSIASHFRKNHWYALGMTLLPSVFYGPLAFHQELLMGDQNEHPGSA